MISTLLHLTFAASNFFTIWYDQTYIDIPMMNHPADMKFLRGRLKFLTIWNVLLQAFFFSLCVLSDLVTSKEQKNPSAITKFKNWLFSTLAFPLAMFVGLTFWGIYFVDRELIFPRALDEFFPVWLNHAMHTNVLVFMLIELVTSFRKYPSRKVGVSSLTAFMAVYLVWIHIIHSYSGRWVYPILEVLSFPLRLVFFAVLLGLVLSLYVVGEKLNNIVWRKRLQQRTASKIR